MGGEGRDGGWRNRVVTREGGGEGEREAIGGGRRR